MAFVTYPDARRASRMGVAHLRLFPSYTVPYIDPFLLLDHFAIQHPEGFPDHPHRGFEIITYVLEGALAHADSAGHESVIPAGGVQKVTAGRGIVHSEMPGTDGIDSGLQLWINLPRAEKGVDPEYQEVKPSELPETEASGVRIRHLVGGGSPVRVRRPMVYQDVCWLADGTWTLRVPAGHQGFFYVLAGRGEVQAAASAPAAATPEASSPMANASDPTAGLAPGDLIFWTGEPAVVQLHIAGQDGLRVVFALGEPVGERPIFNGPFVD
ncbi:hypothetical protein GCM10010885_06080 [Alicyclobacillus cellulosilyticus]|uniref:Pirin N-terminal domain-containing protein n=1 Tax=Alicyclobacillus cellulosilyticus TaxID=1003997 RepID=A0A917NGW5_9BACL|nr:pirin family protein [Alicyclobacillus cellulosilyticus]GGI99581.1 hypothetical protein GCM10010885_06080 [Alicyclobacillus cellulosilyticus]